MPEETVGNAAPVSLTAENSSSSSERTEAVFFEDGSKLIGKTENAAAGEYRTPITNIFRAAAFFIFLLLLSQSVYSQNFNGYYRLTTKWLGEERSLDVINDGVNNKIQMAESGYFTGQHWKITPLGNGYYQLSTQWLGESKSLDVVNDGTNNKLQMAASGNLSGQRWKIEPVESGYYRLTTEWLGGGKSLDVVNDNANNKLQMANSGNFTGQLWKIEAVSFKTTTGTDITRTLVKGFKVNVKSTILNNGETLAALKLLSEKLEEVARLVKPDKLKKLKTVPFWIEYKQVPGKAMWFHKTKDWVVKNGYPAEIAKSVEICNVKNFIDWQTQNQPYLVLHELAHGYHDLYLEPKSLVTDAFKKAFESGKYNNVAYNLGGTKKAYAMENEDEYFAELTEAYFGKNDFYPFNRKELSEFDAEGYKLMQKAWD